MPKPPSTPFEALELGWSILPINRYKMPLIKEWKHLQERQPTPEEVQNWLDDPWISQRLCGWAMITGKVSARIVIDCDDEKSIALMHELGLSPHRQTPRNYHHYDFTHPGFPITTLNSTSDRELKRRWPGLDPRGDGGYAMFLGQAVVKGSRPEKLGDYIWLRDPEPYPFEILPEDLREFLRKRPEKQKANRNKKTKNTGSKRPTIEMLVRMATARVAEGQGRNNTGAWLAQQLRDNRYIKAEALAVDYVAQCPPTNAQGDQEPYTQREWRATVDSTFKRKARDPWHDPKDPKTDDNERKRKRFRLTGEPVTGTAYEFIVNPFDERGDGWFPRGDISIVAASSGCGKTTFVFELLEKQLLGLPVYGHTTNRLPYLVLLEDRGEKSLERTLRRMRIEKDHLPYARLEESLLAEAVQRELLKRQEIPAAVFLEGIDLLGDASDGQQVARDLRLLQQVAEHYHIALIGSTGSPKQRPKDRYISFRDQAIGSTVWSRKAETVVVLQREHGKETDDVTILTVLPRNNRAEQFHLIFESSTGRLRSLTEEEMALRRAKEDASGFLDWVLKREAFTRAEARRAFPGMSGETMTRRLQNLLDSKTILPDGKAGKTPRFIVPSSWVGDGPIN